jgi:hypothetical protein
MNQRTGEDPAPKSSDLEGWRQAVVQGRLTAFKLEAITAAFQDLAAEHDTEVQNGLAKHLSAAVVRILRRRVSPRHPNGGEDIIFRVHDAIIRALMHPSSADGRGLRVAFIPRLLFRLKDAIAAEERERRIPDNARVVKKSKTEKVQASEAEQEIEVVPPTEREEAGEDGDGEAEDFSPRQKRDSSLLDGVTEADQQLDVNRILERVSDPRKRLAFYLFMNGVPYHSKRDGVTSIAQTLGISDRTARDWVEAVRQQLENDDDIKYLRKKTETEYDRPQQN